MMLAVAACGCGALGWVQREKQKGRGKGERWRAGAGVDVSGNWMGLSCLCRWLMNYEMGGGDVSLSRTHGQVTICILE